MTINNKYRFGDLVYLRTDPDQSEYVVTSMRIEPGNVIMYQLAFCDDKDWYYDFEISGEQDKVKKLK